MRQFSGAMSPAALVRRLLAATCLCVLAQSTYAQSFFTTLVTDPVVGADRGSASQIRKLQEPTGFLTASNTGSDAVGRLVLGPGYALPDLGVPGDQLDVAAVWAGPAEDGGRELLAGGVAYRFALGGPAQTGFINLDYGDVTLGTAEGLALDARGDRLQLAAGFSHVRDLGQTARLTSGLEVIARQINSEVLGTSVIDEELRMVRASMLYSRGVPYGSQQRVALAATTGFDGLGASPSGNRMGSNPGAKTDFLKVSIAFEASVPLTGSWTTNLGVIGQWTGDSLPLSQRCGFETNAYARGFDYALVAGDRCIGSLVEMAYDFERPDFQSDRLLATQGFAGIDGGRIDNLENDFSAGGSDTWSSLSIGIRTLRGNVIGEIAATRILDRPDLASDQDRDRLWIRAALQF